MLRTDGEPLELSAPASAMREEFTWMQRLALHPALRTIREEGTSAEALRALAATHTLVYITPAIGNWEYLHWNLVSLEHGLPLVDYAAGLSTRAWRPLLEQFATLLPSLHAWWQERRTWHLPDHVALRRTIAEGRSALVRIKTTAIYDDRYWDHPQHDPLASVLQAHHDGVKPVALVPLQYLWSPRPDHSERRLLDVLFGDRSQPGRLRKLWLLFRNFRRVRVHCGTPLDLRTFAAEHPGLSVAELAGTARGALLTQLSQQRKGFTGPALKPRAWLVDAVANSPRVQRALYDAARAQDATIDDMQLLARKYATEIAADVNYSFVELSTRVLNWVFHTIYDGISTDLDHLLGTIRTAMAQGPVVLVPNHRSHTDYLILSHLLYKHSVALPYVAAGNNLNYWPMGWFFRRVGGFFLRRTFSGNAVYRAVFAEYLRLLVADGHCVEFFIEGGRSRTGKLLMPRYGILSMLTEACDARGTPLTFIPVSITYDRVLEQSSYLSELQGAKKTRESMWDMLRIGTYLRRHYGKIYLQAGAPITLPAATPDNDAERRAFVSDLASQIMRTINRHTVVTPIALVATALLAQKDQASTTIDLQAHCDRLLHFLRWRRAPLSDSLRQSPTSARDGALRSLLRGRLIRLEARYHPHCYTLEPSKRSVLDYSKNNVIHFFITASCVAVSLRAAFLAGATTVPIAHVLEDLQRCQDLFAFEFRFAARASREQHVRNILEYYAGHGWIGGNVDTIHLHMQGAHDLRLFAVLLRNYFESYKAAFFAFRNMPQGEMTEADLLNHALHYAKHLLLLGKIRTPEAISQATFQNALLSYCKMGLLQRHTNNNPGAKPTYHWVSTNPQGQFIQEKLEQWC